MYSNPPTLYQNYKSGFHRNWKRPNNGETALAIFLLTKRLGRLHETSPAAEAEEERRGEEKNSRPTSISSVHHTFAAAPHSGFIGRTTEGEKKEVAASEKNTFKSLGAINRVQLRRRRRARRRRRGEQRGLFHWARSRAVVTR